MNPAIRFNPNLKSSITYTLTLGVYSTSISYVWLNMIDFLILNMFISYAIGASAPIVTSLKQ